MTAPAPSTPGSTLYTFGGDEWIVVQLDEAMSVGVNVRAQAITRHLAALDVDGVVDICPANAAYMIRIDPDVVDPRAMVDQLKEIEAEVGDAADERLPTRLIEIPVFFEDEWTHADAHALPRPPPDAGQDRHRVRGGAQRLPDDPGVHRRDLRGPVHRVDDRLRPRPRLGLPARPRGPPDRVPKYERPRTDTPALAFSWGGAFAAIYPVQGAGGYQLLGICPVPVIDLSQTLPDFKEEPFLHRALDLHRYRQIPRAEYDEIRAKVQEGTYAYGMAEVEFHPGEYFADPEGTAKTLMELSL